MSAAISGLESRWNAGIRLALMILLFLKYRREGCFCCFSKGCWNDQLPTSEISGSRNDIDSRNNDKKGFLIAALKSCIVIKAASNYWRYIIVIIKGRGVQLSRCRTSVWQGPQNVRQDKIYNHGLTQIFWNHDQMSLFILSLAFLNAVCI